MSRPRKPVPKRANVAKPAAPRSAAPSRASRRPLGVAVAIAAVAAVAALFAWRGGCMPGAPRDRVASTDLDRAEAIGLEHLNAGEYVASVPWLRRGTQGAGAAVWGRHYNLALALGRATVLSESRAGVDVPLVRSSLERVDMARECEAAFARARALAPTAADRAVVQAANAEFQFAWGRMWEAFVLFRQAQADAPGDTAMAGRADWFQLLLEKPGRFETVEESMRAAAVK